MINHNKNYLINTLSGIIVELQTVECNVIVYSPITLNPLHLSGIQINNDSETHITAHDVLFNKPRTFELSGYNIKYFDLSGNDHIKDILKNPGPFNHRVLSAYTVKTGQANRENTTILHKISSESIALSALRYMALFTYGQLHDNVTTDDILNYNCLKYIAASNNKEHCAANLLGINKKDLDSTDVQILSACKQKWFNLYSIKINELLDLLRSYNMEVDNDIAQTFKNVYLDPMHDDLKTPRDVAKFWPSILYPKPVFIL